MFEWIHTKGVTKIYNMLRKPRTPFGWHLCIKAMIYGFWHKICNTQVTIIAQLYAVFILSQLQHSNITYLVKITVTHAPSTVSLNTKKFINVR